LATTANGIPLKFTDALDISSDGIIYLTDASVKYGQNEYLYDLLESKPYGLVLAVNEQGKVTQSLHDPLAIHLRTITSSREYDG
jgi:sugar lactone lactonase YvrE